LQLAPGDTLELESSGERILLRPVRAAAPLTKEQGIWVFRTGQTLTASLVDETRRQVRDERDQQNLGPT